MIIVFKENCVSSLVFMMYISFWLPLFVIHLHSTHDIFKHCPFFLCLQWQIEIPPPICLTSVFQAHVNSCWTFKRVLFTIQLNTFIYCLLSLLCFYFRRTVVSRQYSILSGFFQFLLSEFTFVSSTHHIFRWWFFEL